MRIISTLFFLFIASYSFSQPADTVVITGNCWGTYSQSVKEVPLTNGPTGIVTGLNVQKTESGVLGLGGTWCCRSIRSLPESDQPMIIVDGKPIKLNIFLFEINPKDIESVEIFGSAAATAIFGHDAVNGAIWIITKATKLRKFIIKDVLDGSRIAGATVSIKSIEDKNERFQFVADDSGVIVPDKLNRTANYTITVSAVGHQSAAQIFENSDNYKAQEILLAREVKTCDEAVVSVISCYRTIRCGYRITRSITRKQANDETVPSFKVFPNPLQKGNSITIQSIIKEDKLLQIRLISPDGRLLFSKLKTASKGMNRFSVDTDARWSAGIYFVQLLYENGRVAASEKIILQ